MRSGRECIDMDEAIEWVLEKSKRLGKPIPIDVVVQVLCLYVEFQLSVGNVAVVVESPDDPIIIAVAGEGDALSKDFNSLRWMLGSRTSPSDEDTSKDPPQ